MSCCEQWCKQLNEDGWIPQMIYRLRTLRNGSNSSRGFLFTVLWGLRRFICSREQGAVLNSCVQDIDTGLTEVSWLCVSMKNSYSNWFPCSTVDLVEPSRADNCYTYTHVSLRLQHCSCVSWMRLCIWWKRRIHKHATTELKREPSGARSFHCAGLLLSLNYRNLCTIVTEI